MRLYRSDVAIGLGCFSIGLGVMELLAGRRVARSLGLEHRTGLIRLFGLRELVNGFALLRGRGTRAWSWARVAGDLLDLGLLATALSPRNLRRDRAALAAAGVLGIGVLDVANGAVQR
jgi:hypothetical protein